MSYGLLPFVVAASTPVVLDWLTGGGGSPMVEAAEEGKPVGVEAYVGVPRTMRIAPLTLLDAYEQAAYFVALGIRRAIANGNTLAENNLRAQLAVILAEGDAHRDSRTAICSAAGGLFCRRGGSFGVLGNADEALRMSSLEISDSDKIRAFIRTNRRLLTLRTVLPVTLGLGLVGAILWRSTRD